MIINITSHLVALKGTRSAAERESRIRFGVAAGVADVFISTDAIRIRLHSDTIVNRKEMQQLLQLQIRDGDKYYHFHHLEAVEKIEYDYYGDSTYSVLDITYKP